MRESNSFRKFVRDHAKQYKALLKIYRTENPKKTDNFSHDLVELYRTYEPDIWEVIEESKGESQGKDIIRTIPVMRAMNILHFYRILTRAAIERVLDGK